MIWTNGHPGYRSLNRFVDGELSVGERRGIAAHVLRCRRCRGRVDFLRRVGELARSLEPPRAPETILRGALARRRLGERIQVSHPPDPVCPMAPRPRPTRPALRLH